MADKAPLIVTEEERARAVARSRKMYQTDLASNMATVEARGEARGEARVKREIARNLLGINMPIDQIVQITGLGREEIEALSDR